MKPIVEQRFRISPGRNITLAQIEYGRDFARNRSVLVWKRKKKRKNAWTTKWRSVVFRNREIQCCHFTKMCGCSHQFVERK